MYKYKMLQNDYTILYYIDAIHDMFTAPKQEIQ